MTWKRKLRKTFRRVAVQAGAGAGGKHCDLVQFLQRWHTDKATDSRLTHQQMATLGIAFSSWLRIHSFFSNLFQMLFALHETWKGNCRKVFLTFLQTCNSLAFGLWQKSILKTDSEVFAAAAVLFAIFNFYCGNQNEKNNIIKQQQQQQRFIFFSRHKINSTWKWSACYKVLWQSKVL